MLNNITNFFNLIKTGMVKTQLEAKDVIPIGTKDASYGGTYKPTLIEYANFVAGLVGGSNGQVLFNDADTIAGASNLYWDKVNERVGIGTSSPSFGLDVNGTARVQGDFTATGNITSSVEIFSNFGFVTNSAILAIFNKANNSGRIAFYTNTGGVSTERLRCNNNGNVLINTTTDAGFLLDVNGTARVQGLIDSTNTFNSLGAFSTGIGLSKTTLNSSTNFSDVISVQGLARSLNNFAYRVYGVKGIGATDGLFGSQSIDIITGVQGSISVGNSNKTVTTAMSLYASAGTIGTGNTITNYYGAYLETPTGTGITNKWGLFQQDTTSKNYFGGNVLINTTTDAGFTLDVNGITRVGTTDGIRFIPSNNSSIIFSQGVDRISLTRLNSDKLQITAQGTNTVIGNGISTNGSAHTWLLEGEVIAASTVDTTKHVKVFINGVAYKLALCV